VPNDKLHRVTDTRLAEVDRKDLHGLCWWSKLVRYGGLPVFRALKVSVAILNLMRASMVASGVPLEWMNCIRCSLCLNNACKGILCALKARNMFRWNTIQNRICVIKPGRNKSGGNSLDG